MADPIDVNKLDELEKRLATLYQRVDRLGQIEAENLAKAQRQASNLVSEIGRMEKEMEDLIFQSDYLYRSFQETTAELKNQNVVLKLGKSAFQGLADISRDINQYQRGNADINEKNFKKMESSFKLQKEETDYIVEQLEKEKEDRENILDNFNDRIKEGEKLSKAEKQILDILTKQQGLYLAAKNAIQEEIPILQKEFEISKQIANVRKDIGGLATAAAGTISKYGGSLSRFLNINEAIEAVDEYNKNLIDSALKNGDIAERLNQIEKEKIDLQKDIIRLKQEERQVTQEINLEQTKLNNLNSLSADIANLNLEKLKEEKALGNDISSYLNGKEDLIKNIIGSLELEKAQQDAIIDSLNAQVDIKNQIANLTNTINDKEQERNALQAALRDEGNAIFTTLEAQLQAQQRIAQLDVEIFNARRIESQKRNEQSILQNSLGEKLVSIEDKVNEKLNEQVSLQDKITGLQSKQAQIGEQVLSKENNLQAELNNKEEEAYELRQKAIQSVDTFGNKLGALGIVTKNLGAGFLKALKDPLTVLTFLIDKGLDANKQAVELGKSLGYGTDRANAFRENIVQIARDSTNINVTAASLNKAFSELVQATGFAYEFTADQLATQVKLTEQVGLQADTAAQVQRIAVLNGKTSEETYNSYIKGLTAARNQNKVGIDFKSTLAEALKVSGRLAANLGYNPERIAKAVVQAKALGMTLEQVAKAGDSLLDWESSIEKELKAELLTGRELNLERARAAALAGDQVALAEELAKNVGTSADFSKMNVLQQKALAESVGMTADELADTLRKREEAIKQGKSLAQITEEEAKEAAERQDIQKKFNQAILKLQDIIGNLVAGPVGQLLDVFANILSFVSGILGKWYILYPLIGVVALSYIPKMVSGFGSMLGSISSIGKGLASAFSKETYTDFFKGLKDKFLESKSLAGKVKEKVTETVTGNITEKGTESIGDKLKDKVTEETIENKTEDKTKDLTEKVTGKTEEIGAKTETVEKGNDGSKFKDKMKNIAEGIKAFGDGKVILGGLVGLPASAVGLIAFIPGWLGIKAIQSVDGEKFQKAAEGIANGVKAFGTSQVTGGAANLILTSVGLVAMIPGVLGAKLIEQINEKKIQDSLEGIANGIKAFGENVTAASILKLTGAGIALTLFTAAVPGLILLRLVNGDAVKKSLTSVGEGIKSFSQAVSWNDLLKAAGAIALFGAALIPAAYAFKMFADVPWEGMAKAGVTLIGLGLAGKIIGSMAPEMIKGAVAIAVLGASLIPAAYALQMFTDIKWETLAVAGAALVGLATIAGIIGAPPIIGFILMGAAGIAALGASLIPFALAARIATPAIEAFGNVISKVFSGISGVITAAAEGISTIFTTLQNVDVTKLLSIGPALIGIGAGLAALGAGSVVEAIGSFLGGGPIEKLQELAAAGDGLQQTTTALQNMATALTGVSLALANIDTAKLEKLGEFSSNMTGGSIIGGITNLITAPIKAVGEVINGGGEEKVTPSTINSTVDLTPMIAAINEVKVAVDKLYNKNTTISLDGKTIGSTLVQGSYSYA